MSKVLTGILGFDADGGLPRGRTTLVMGGPGCGKTVFALQSLGNGAQSARQIVAKAATFESNALGPSPRAVRRRLNS
jgi:KaiC/GvpD/RAD55 family RecA-like ATPase